MNQSLWQFAVTAFVTILVVVDPLGLAPMFVGLTAGHNPTERRAILRRSIVIALGVALLFLFVGRGALSYLGVSIHAFGISGGILLFATALPMLFGGRAALQRPDGGESSVQSEDIAIFPLAIPLLAGPGTITTILLLATRGDGHVRHQLALAAAIVAVFAVSFWVLLWGEKLVRRVGEGGVHIATRVLGILLAALAVQFVLNGLSGYYASLAAVAH
jgi:multiple antibiotic resistance protein